MQLLLQLQSLRLDDLPREHNHEIVDMRDSRQLSHDVCLTSRIVQQGLQLGQ